MYFIDVIILCTRVRESFKNILHTLHPSPYSLYSPPISGEGMGGGLPTSLLSCSNQSTFTPLSAYFHPVISLLTPPNQPTFTP